MDEFGETPTYYIWPKGHVEGDPIPDDFYTRLREAMESADLEYESV